MAVLYSDSITLANYPVLTIDLGNDTLLCPGDSLLLDATMVGVTYGWSNLSTNSTLMIYQPGTYWVDVMQNGCTYSDTIVISYNNAINLDLGNDTSLCDGVDYLIDLTVLGGTFLWQDLSTGPTFLVTQPDTISVEVTDGVCSYIDSLIVDYYLPNTSFLGNDTTVCPGDILTVETQLYGTAYLWSDNSTDSLITVSTMSNLWLDVTGNDGCTYSDTILVDYYPLVNVSLGADTLLCDGANLVLDVTTLNATYEWQDASVNSSFMVTQPGTYWVNVSQNNCVFTDTIIISYDTDTIKLRE